MKVLLVVLAILNFGLGYSQSNQNYYVDTLQYDSVRHIRTYRMDSTLFRTRICKFDEESKQYKCIQSVTYTKEGMIDTFHSVYDMNRNNEGQISTDELIVKLDGSGKPIKLWWVNNFKLFKAYKYDEEKGKYKKIKVPKNR